MGSSSSARGLPRLLLFFISLFTSCTLLLDPPLSLGSPRAEDHRRGSPSGALAGGGRDTLMLVSAVCFPESYDWQRDSAYGNVACTLRLFRGKQDVLGIPAGPGTTVSASPDGHHIIDGELYTVYSDAGGTCIGRGGNPLAHWAEREYITGLLPSGGDVYTLGVDDGGGLVFRCNGREFFKDPGGIPFGGFGSDTYGPGGALYSDGGAVCFAYLRGGSETVFVRDGEQDGPPIAPMATNILDARYIDGGKYVLYNQSGKTMLYENGSCRTVKGFTFTDAGLVKLDGRIFCAGNCTGTENDSEYCAAWNPRISFIFHGRPDRLYQDGATFVSLYLDEYPACRFFGKSCGKAFDGSIAVALTPRDGSAPFVSYKGARTEYPVHGFLSGVDFFIQE